MILEAAKNYREWQQKLNLFRPQAPPPALPLLPSAAGAPFLPFGTRLPVSTTLSSPLQALTRAANFSPFQNYINQVSFSFVMPICVISTRPGSLAKITTPHKNRTNAFLQYHSDVRRINSAGLSSHDSLSRQNSALENDDVEIVNDKNESDISE